MATKVVTKATGASDILGQARDMVARIREQAKEGEVDGALLDQLGGMLEVTADTASTPSDMASTPGAPSEAPSAPAPSIPTSTPSSPSIPSAISQPSESSPSIPSEVKKEDMPFSTRTPSPNLIFYGSEDINAKVGQFSALMEAGQLAKAQRYAGDQITFDQLFARAQTALLTQTGISSANIGALRKFSAVDPSDPNTLMKAIVSTDMPGVYLSRLVKLMLPVYAGLRRRLPVEPPHPMSDQALWRIQSSFGALDFSAMMSNAEAADGQAITTAFLNFAAPYKSTAVNDSVNLQAIASSRGYDDPMQVAVLRAMAAILHSEENIVLGGNGVALATPVPTGAVVNSGGALAAGTYYVGVSALTYRGWLNGSQGTTGAVGETVVGATTVQTVTATITGTINVTWPAVPGAVAYNVFITALNGTAVDMKYKQTVMINKVSITTVAGLGSKAPVASDTSVNANGYEGLLNWCELATVYTRAITGKITITDNAGLGLTAANGGISQFDTVLANLWTTWQICPTLMVMSPNMAATVTGKLLTLGATTGFIHIASDSDKRGQIEGGAFATSYVNKFAPYADGSTKMVDILAHPYMPDGTILFLSESIPYPTGREARGFSLDVQVPYTYFPLYPTATIVYPFSLLFSESLECYHPAAQTAICGIDYTL